VDDFMSNNTMTLWGFWLSVIGTIVGIISLWISIQVGLTTYKVRYTLKKLHLQDKYKKSKKTIMLQLRTSYSLMVDENYIDEPKITESIISLLNFNEILTKTTKRHIKKMQKDITNSKKVSTDKGKRELRDLLWTIITRLETEFDEKNEYLKGVIK
jgi:hypothetical protein